MKKIPRVLVCQHGARHRYAIPRMLEKVGLLEALYTDSSAYSPLGKVARALGSFAPTSVQRLARRKVEGIPEHKIYSSDILVYNTYVRKILQREYSEYNQWCSVLSKEMKAWTQELPHFDVVYNMFCENLEFIRYIKKSHGKKVISDIYVHPQTNSIVDSEFEKLHIPPITERGIQNIDISAIKEICELSDVLLCPSEFVAEGVVSLDPNFENKISICPYGSSINFGGAKNIPIRGRIFWAGGDWVRKGLHILSEVADRLSAIHPDVEFRVAGLQCPDVSGMFSNLNFKGKLTVDQMKEEFLNADVFVFPTISEGMAGAVIEALAAGCPVITTKACGIDGLSDGEQGFVVSQGDVGAIEHRILEIYNDRKLRDRLSDKATLLANDYTQDAWSKRLSGVIEGIQI